MTYSNTNAVNGVHFSVDNCNQDDTITSLQSTPTYNGRTVHKSLFVSHSYLPHHIRPQNLGVVIVLVPTQVPRHVPAHVLVQVPTQKPATA